MSIWKSDKKLFIFASLVSPSKIVLFEKWYEAFDTSKFVKNTPLRAVSSTLRLMPGMLPQFARPSRDSVDHSKW